MLINLVANEVDAQSMSKKTNKEHLTLKILSWNIYMLPYLSMLNNNENRARAIAEKLNETDYQIIVFQEAFTSKSRRLLSKKLMKSYPFQYGPANKLRLPSLFTNSGLWVVSKIPLTELGQIRFSVSYGFDMIARKGAVLFGGEYGGKKFQILTTHLQADGSGELRELQCNEIRDKLLNKYYDDSVPQLICGDFNIDMHNDQDNYIQMLNTLEAKNGEISGDIKCTYDEKDNTLVKKTLGKQKVIDYILIRNDQLIDRIDRKVHTFYEKLGHDYANLSDHYAMEATISF